MEMNEEGKLIVDPQKMMNDGYGDIGKVIGFIIARFVEKNGSASSRSGRRAG